MVARWSGQDHGWVYMAQRIDGSGEPGEWLDRELPLTGVQVTDVLSGPPRISGTIDPVYLRTLGPDGQPLLNEWGTVLYAQEHGSIAGGAIYTSGTFDGPQWSLDAAGFTAYPAGEGYEGELVPPFINADPLDIVRHIWDHLQGGVASNLGLAVDQSTATPVRVGTATKDNGEDGPYELNEWSNQDLGSDIDDLSGSTPFDYHERHFWNQRRDEVLHELTFGYPRIGTRRPGLRFVFGENVQVMPQAARDGAQFANHIRFLGAGEGRDMVRAEARVRDGRLRRMATVEDKSVTGLAHAHRRARIELDRRRRLLTVPSVVVRDTPTTPVGALQVGDEVRLQGRLDWIDVDLWVRILTITKTPDSPSVAALSLMRSELT